MAWSEQARKAAIDARARRSRTGKKVTLPEYKKIRRHIEVTDKRRRSGVIYDPPGKDK